MLALFVFTWPAGGPTGAERLRCWGAPPACRTATAGLLKEVMGTFDRGFEAVATTWPLYAFIVVGLVGLLLNQLAYQAGPLRSSLALIITVDPVASLVIGVAVFDEQFRNQPADLVGEAFGLALVVVAAAGLTRSIPGPVRERPNVAKEQRSALSCAPTAEALWAPLPQAQAVGGN